MKRRKDNKGRVLEKGESQRKNGLYVFQYKDATGVRKSIYNKNLSDLRKEERRIRRDIEDGVRSDEAEKTTLNELFKRYMSLKSNLANSTRENYIGLWDGNIKDSFLGNKRISDIRKSDILRFYQSLEDRGLKYSTISFFNGMIAPCLEMAVDDDLIRKNPCKDCLKKFFKDDAKVKNSLTQIEQKELLNFVQSSAIYAKKYPMIMVAIGTAMRCGELIGLTWNDVDFAKNKIRVTHQLIYKKKDGKYQFYIATTKTRAGLREIPMTRDVREALKAQREYQFKSGTRTDITIDGYEDFVFSTKNKRPIMPSAVNNLLLNIVSAHNKEQEKNEASVILPDISAHTLRHTGCTRMAEVGIDVKVLQYIMGHNDIKVTMEVYNHVSEERNKKEMEKMEKLRLMG